MIQRYVAKISGPLMDRIDIHIDVPAVNYKEMRSANVPEGSAQIRERVIRARELQLQRFAGGKRKIYSNAQMTSSHVRTFCELNADCERLLERAMTHSGFSARVTGFRKWRGQLPIWNPCPRFSPGTSPKRFSTARWIAPTGRRDLAAWAAGSSGSGLSWRECSAP